jgi:hypothetical protein
MKRQDLVEDIRNSPEIMAKIRAEDRYYAQNLYAAWCNMQWCKRELWPVLKEEYWTASWRRAGGIVADLRNEGEDYIDYYCSGMRGGLSFDGKEDDEYFDRTRFQGEGVVTDEILNDLDRIGWFPVPYKDEDLGP